MFQGYDQIGNSISITHMYMKPTTTGQSQTVNFASPQKKKEHTHNNKKATELKIKRRTTPHYSEHRLEKVRLDHGNAMMKEPRL